MAKENVYIPYFFNYYNLTLRYGLLAGNAGLNNNSKLIMIKT